MYNGTPLKLFRDLRRLTIIYSHFSGDFIFNLGDHCLELKEPDGIVGQGEDNYREDVTLAVHDASL